MVNEMSQGESKMRGKVVKKIRKYSKRNWFEYVEALRQWPFMARLRFCWYIIKGKKKEL